MKENLKNLPRVTFRYKKRKQKLLALKSMVSRYDDIDMFARDASWLELTSTFSEGRRLFIQLRR